MKSVLSLLVLLVLGVPGCAALLASSEALGDSGQVRWGVVEYDRSGPLKPLREKDARDTMTAYCAPHSYRITETQTVGEKLNVRFECLPQ